MTPRALKCAMAPFAAAALAAVLLTMQHRWQADPHVRYDRFQLPSYDAYVYVAMAERPLIFTVAPWGYRLLAPLVVHLAHGRNVVRGYLVVSVCALTLAAALLFLFLRRLGHGPLVSLFAMTLFCLSPPVAEAVCNGINTDALAVALLLACLCAVESGTSLAALCLLATLGALTKEVLLIILIPLVFFASLARRGVRQALWRTAVVAAPTTVAALILRHAWAPQVGGTILPGLDQIPAAVSLTIEHWREWWRPVLLWGLTPLALLGATRGRARTYLARYGAVAAVTGLVPFVSAVYGGGAQVKFLSGDIPRLMLYPLPVWLPLALTALGRTTERRTTQSSSRTSPAVEGLLYFLTLLILVALPFGLDRYRHVDLRGSRDGPLLLALARESPRVALRLARGHNVTFSPATHGWAWNVSDPPLLNRMRWFLREGWGDLAHYGVHDITMRGREARILLPCARPTAIHMRLEMVAHTLDPVTLLVNGRPLGVMRIATSTTTGFFVVEAASLFRGDNVLELRRERDAVPGPRLLRLTYKPVGSK